MTYDYEYLVQLIPPSSTVTRRRVEVDKAYRTAKCSRYLYVLHQTVGNTFCEHLASDWSAVSRPMVG